MSTCSDILHGSLDIATERGLEIIIRQRERRFHKDRAAQAFDQYPDSESIGAKPTTTGKCDGKRFRDVASESRQVELNHWRLLFFGGEVK